jgi:hypothetical protein
MPLADVLMSILGKKGLSATMEVRQFFQATGKADEDEMVSKQDYLRQRQHLNPDVFTILNQEYLRNFYSGAEEAECWHGHVYGGRQDSSGDTQFGGEPADVWGKREQVWESGSAGECQYAL